MAVQGVRVLAVIVEPKIIAPRLLTRPSPEHAAIIQFPIPGLRRMTTVEVMLLQIRSGREVGKERVATAA